MLDTGHKENVLYLFEIIFLLFSLRTYIWEDVCLWLDDEKEKDTGRNAIHFFGKLNQIYR